MVQAAYPTAVVVFPQTCAVPLSPPASSAFEALLPHLAARSAARHAAAVHSVAASPPLLTRAAPPPSPQWWTALYSRRPASGTGSLPPWCPPAIVYIDGVEAADVAAQVAPTLIQHIPTLAPLPADPSHHHRGERQPPSYVTRHPNWSENWLRRRCTLHGANLLELAVPLSSSASPRPAGPSAPSPPGLQWCDSASERHQTLVLVAPPSVSVSDLHRERNSARRLWRRSSFGYSLSYLKKVLPAPVVVAVQVLRRWQSAVPHRGGVSTSAFWVSVIGHVLSSTSEAIALSSCIAELQDRRFELKIPEEAKAKLQGLTAGWPKFTSDAAVAALADEQLFAYLLFRGALRAVMHDATGVNGGQAEEILSNYFLPCETFKDSTDATLLATLRAATREDPSVLSYDYFGKLYWQLRGDEARERRSLEAGIGKKRKSTY